MSAALRCWFPIGLTVLCLFVSQPLRAQAIDPASLPELVPSLALSEPGARTSGFSWQLHQRLELFPDGSHASLALNPSVSISLLDPRSELQSEQALLEAQLGTLDRSGQLARTAQGLHSAFLGLQNSLWLEAGLQQLLELWPSLPAPADSADQPVEQLRHQEMLDLILDVQAHSAQLLLQLDLAGVGIGGAPGSWFRPSAVTGAEPLPLCMTGNRDLRRLELLQRLAELDSLLARAGRDYAVDLDLGLNLGVNFASAAAPQPQFGWNAALRLARADFSGPQLRLDVSAHSLSQSVTVRGPGPAAPAGSVVSPEGDLRQSSDQVALSLVSLLQAADQAVRDEDRQRQRALLAYGQLNSRLSAGTATTADLSELAQQLLALARAAVHHDQLLLQLAVDCRLPLHYRELAEYP